MTDEELWRGALAWSMGIGLLYLALAVAFGSPVTIALGYNTVGVGAVAAGVFATRRTKSRVFLWFTIGTAAWALGDVIWDVWSLRYGDPPYPSVIELLYFAYYPFVGLGLLHVRRASGELHRTLLGALTSVIALAWLVGGVVAVSQQGDTTSAKVAAAGLIVGDAVMIFLFAHVALDRRWAMPKWLHYMLGSLMFVAVGDMLYGVGSATGAYDTGGLADVLVVASSLLFTLSVLHPTALASVVDDA